MRLDDCRDHIGQIVDLCNVSPQTIKTNELVAKFCKEKGNAPLKRCATDALLPIIKIKDKKIQNLVIAEANKLLKERNDVGEYIKERLSGREIKTVIAKYDPSIRKKLLHDKQPRYRLTDTQQNIIKRLISLKYTKDERESFVLIFKWAAERIAKQK